VSDATMARGLLSQAKSLLPPGYLSDEGPLLDLRAQHSMHNAHNAPAPSLLWSCWRPQTPDDLPVVGRSGMRNVYFNSGHGHLGLTRAVGASKLLAGLIISTAPTAPTASNITAHHSHAHTPSASAQAQAETQALAVQWEAEARGWLPLFRPDRFSRLLSAHDLRTAYRHLRRLKP
jgi:hypothetical protein